MLVVKYLNLEMMLMKGGVRKTFECVSVIVGILILLLFEIWLTLESENS